jgi:hypothetical protein
MKKPMKRYGCIVLTSAALAAAAAAGCASSAPDKTAQVDQSADEREQNRLLVRLALAENVYNGVATERVMYPKDFDPGTAKLNELGTRRVEALAYACRGGSSRVAVVRGDEPDELYEARLAAVRDELALAGLDAKEINVSQDGQVSGETASTERALLTFDKMMSRYAPQQGGPGGGGGSGAGVGMRASPSTSGGSSNGK